MKLLIDKKTDVLKLLLSVFCLLLAGYFLFNFFILLFQLIFNSNILLIAYIVVVLYVIFYFIVSIFLIKYSGKYIYSRFEKTISQKRRLLLTSLFITVLCIIGSGIALSMLIVQNKIETQNIAQVKIDENKNILNKYNNWMDNNITKQSSYQNINELNIDFINFLSGNKSEYAITKYFIPEQYFEEVILLRHYDGINMKLWLAENVTKYFPEWDGNVYSNEISNQPIEYPGTISLPRNIEGATLMKYSINWLNYYIVIKNTKISICTTSYTSFKDRLYYISYALYPFGSEELFKKLKMNN